MTLTRQQTRLRAETLGVAGSCGMSVLVTGFDWHGDLVPFVRRGLSELAQNTTLVTTSVDALMARPRTLKSIESVPVIGRPLGWRWRARLAERAAVSVNEQFCREVTRTRPDVVLSILCWGEPLTAASLASVRGATRIGWLMDDPFGYERSQLQDLLMAYDRLYIIDDGWADNVQLMTGIRPHWLPCGADPVSHHPVDLSRRDTSLSDHIVYVGSSCYGHPAGALRRALIDSLEGLPVAVFGDEGWRRFGGFAAASYRGGPVDTSRANAIYGSGAIALNFHHPQFRRGTSLRTFALCAAGAFQLTDWREGLDRWFSPGRELEVFRSPQELRELATRYLLDSAGRQRIARAGRDRVLSEHTYARRLEVMLQNVTKPVASVTQPDSR